MAILMMLILPIYEHGTCFHLFVSSLISFFGVVYFSEYRSFISLVRFIPRYFVFLVAIPMRFFSDFCVWYLLLVYKNAFKIWILTFYCADLPNQLFRLSSFLVESIGFSMYTIMSSANIDSFISSFPIWMPLFLFLVWLLWF